MAGSVLALLLAGAGSAAPQSYTITDLGTMGGLYCSAWRINNRGQVIGSITLTPNRVTARAFLWENGVATQLPSLGGIQTTAVALNDAGQIVGSAALADNQTQHAVLWQNGGLRDLGTLGGANSAAGGINADGQIVGSSQTAGDTRYHGVVWQDGVMTDLTASLNLIGAAHGVNAAGQVIADFKWNQACVWQAGAARDLGSLGGPFFQPLAINDAGQIVGASVLPASGRQGTIRACMADGDGMHDLGSLGGIWSYAFGINRSGDVVGSSTGGLAFGRHAFLYSRGVLQDLNALIPAGSGWVLTAANGINDRGQIVGEGLVGGEQHAFLLDPPAPAAPSGLVASVLSASRIALSWTDNSTIATAFALWRRSGSDPFARIAVLPPDTTRYTDAGLTPGATYVYRVQAIGLGGASDWSNDAPATAQAPALPPPTFLSAALSTLATARLTWSDNSQSETAFAIWRKDGAADWARVGVVPPNSNRFVDTGLQPGTTYDYRVRAINDTVASEWSNEAVLTSRPRPATPAGLTIQVYGSGTIRLDWTGAGAEETGITLFRKAGNGDWAPIAVLPPGTIEYLDWAVSPQTNYTYRLRAHNNSYASDWSSEASGTTLPLP